MANPTSNFGWQMPTNTDLVKDLPADFEVFGQAVDTSLMDLKGGTTGQVLSKASNTDMDFTWVTSDDANAIQNTIVDAKGDLISATGNDVPARLAVGNNGETLVADSSATTGLRWQGLFAAGKNKIINGDFNINQRAFSSTTTSATYGFDRWDTTIGGDGTCTYSAQTFTAGAAPVTGYEAANYARLLTASQTATNVSSYLRQKIEDVRTFANQTITISFWAKAASGTPKIALELIQAFGSGGSPSSSVATYGGQVTLSTSWARYSLTVAVPSISGKTIGTTANSSSLNIHLWVSAGSDFNARTGTLGIQNNTFDIWGVQAESGSVATPFTTATGTLAGELAACQRYYYRFTPTGVTRIGVGYVSATTEAVIQFKFPVTMRTAPTALEQSGTAGDYSVGNATVTTCSGVPGFSSANTECANVSFAVASGLTTNDAIMARPVNANGYLGWSAEL